MSFYRITCPNCAHNFPLDEVIHEQFRQQSEERADAKFQAALQLLQERVATIASERDVAQQNELRVHQEKQALEDRNKNIDLEITRQADARVAAEVAAARSEQAIQFNLDINKEREISESLRRKVDELQRDTRQTLPVRQGDVLENEIETRLRQTFQGDLVSKIEKGMRGADRLLTVRDRGRECGKILIEAKNTKYWGSDWLDKAKADQHESGAHIVVIASNVVPPEISAQGGFGEIDRVFVADLSSWFALVCVLRDRIIAVKNAYAAAEGKAGTAGEVYDLVVSGQFRDTMGAMIKAINAGAKQDGRFRNAVLAHFDKQHKNRQRLYNHLAGLYGAIHGIVGGNSPTVPELEFDTGDEGLDDDNDVD
jgi:hypothetical protein